MARRIQAPLPPYQNTKREVGKTTCDVQKEPGTGKVEKKTEMRLTRRQCP